MEPSTENDMSRATIEPESVRSGLIGSSWRFVAKDDSQRVIAATDVFECNGHALKDGKQARLALEALIDLLRRDGWVGERAPNQTNGTTWYDYTFARKRASEPVASLPVLSPPVSPQPVRRPSYLVIKARGERTGLLLPYWRFIAVDREGNVFAESQRFDSGIRTVVDGKPERKALEALMMQLRLDGWIMDMVPSQHADWYAYGFRSPDVPGSPVAQMTYQSSPKSGVSIPVMWGITLFVVILLFVVCVVLVLSAQIVIRPAT